MSALWIAAGIAAAVAAAWAVRVLYRALFGVLAAWVCYAEWRDKERKDRYERTGR